MRDHAEFIDPPNPDAWGKLRQRKLNGAPYQAGRSDIRIRTAAALRLKEFAPIKFVVRDYIVEGCTLLAGRPKIGKSWLMLEIGLAVARGGCCLNDIQCEQGDTLYLALEDNERRLQNRITRILGYGQEWPQGFHYAVEWSRGDAGVEEIRKWIASVSKPRLIIVDVLTMFRSPRLKDQQPFENDYAAIKGLQTLASETGLAIVIVHHLRKGTSEIDPFEKVSGTLGLSGAADSVLILDRDAQGATLYGRGRDIEEIETAVQFSRETCRWRTLGTAVEVRRTDERSVIMETLRTSKEPLSPRDISDLTDTSYEAIRQMLVRMAKDGEIMRTGRGLYRCDSGASKDAGVTSGVTTEKTKKRVPPVVTLQPPVTTVTTSRAAKKATETGTCNCDSDCNSNLSLLSESQLLESNDHLAAGCDDVTVVTPPCEGESQGTLECWGMEPEHIRKKYYPNTQPHLVTEFAAAFRTGSYTSRLCKPCAESQLNQTYPGGPWWTQAGSCAVCGIAVYLNPSMMLHHQRHPETKLLCTSKCGRTPRLSSRALQKAELQTEQERADANRKERQRIDQLINDDWPEEEAF